MTDIQPPAQVANPAYTGPERRTRLRDREWREDVNRRFTDGTAKMNRLHEELKANTAATERVDANTAELVSLLNSFKGAFTVFDLIGRAARPVGYIAAACAALWGLFVAVKGGVAPK